MMIEPHKKRSEEYTYTSWSYHFYMSRCDFKEWYKSIGCPEIIGFIFDTTGSDAFNPCGTERKGYTYEFYIRTEGVKKALCWRVGKGHMRYKQVELEKNYTRWANQVKNEFINVNDLDVNPYK